MALRLGDKEWFVLIIAIILLTDIVILLDVPVLRVIFGFLCFTLLPGALILFILKLNKIGITEKIVLSVGLSVSFLIFFGFLIDKLYFSLGYATPLSTISVVVTFSAVMIILFIVGCKTNKEAFSFAMPDFNLNTTEKAFLIIPVMFPALSVFGMHIMNTIDDNIILMFLLFLIPIYVAFVCFFNHKFPKRFYPVVIFLISISLLLLHSLRSNHIIGADTHTEYYYFRMIFNNLHWDILGHSVLDACLASSLLPSIYQSFLNVNGEYLYKILYSLLFSVVPLIVFVISKKYVGELYAFLASIFFMSQSLFIRAGINPRTSTAILFFALAMMTLFSDKIDPLKKRILFIVFMASVIISHYSTAYIFFFIMLFGWFSIEILAKRFTLKKNISLTMVLLFFGIIFFWYSQVTEVAFNTGVDFVEQTFLNLHNFFIMESRCGRTEGLLGEGIMYKGIPHKIEFVFTWLTFVLISVGVISMLKKYKEMVVIQGIKHLKPDFLKTKFSIEYLVLTLACAGLLVIMIAVPYISEGYDIKRLYTMMTVILSVVFVLGGIMLSKHFFFFVKRKPVLKEKQKNLTENTSQVRAYLIILLVLVPYFMCTTGTMYQIFGVPREITLNSDGFQYNASYIHDQESYALKWLGKNREQDKPRMRYYTDYYGLIRLISQGKILSNVDQVSLVGHGACKGGYIYLRYYNVVNGKLMDESIGYNMTDYSDVFVVRNEIYDNGGSEIWK
jgi:uncharacterized membrane protein